MSRSVGGAVGTAIAGAVFSSKVRSHVPSSISQAVIAAGLPGNSVAIVVEGIATNNLTLAQSAPGVTQQILDAGQLGYLQGYAYS
jgi:hypothetical protein